MSTRTIEHPLNQEAIDYITKHCRTGTLEDYYLGTICRQGHNFGGSGFSLKRKKSRTCLQCSRTATHQFYSKDRVEHPLNQEAIDYINKMCRTLTTEDFYFGPICKNGHEFGNSGFSLRNKRTGICHECNSEGVRRHYEKNRESQLACQLRYRQRRKALLNQEEINYLAKHIKKPHLFFLGTLCHRGHDFNSSGKSIRYKSNGICVECHVTEQRRKSDGKKAS